MSSSIVGEQIQDGQSILSSLDATNESIVSIYYIYIVNIDNKTIKYIHKQDGSNYIDDISKKELRAQRKKEQEEQQQQNNRLEQYIQKQRERDAGDGGWKKEYDLLQSKYSRDLSKQQTLYNRQIQSTRNINHEHVDTINKQKAENSQLISDIEQIKNELNTYESTNINQQQRNTQQSNQLVEYKTNLFISDEKIQTQQDNYNIEHDKLTKLLNDINNESESYDEQNSKYLKLQQKYDILQNQYESYKTVSQKDIKSLENQARTYQKMNTVSIDTIRKEYEDKINELFLQRYHETKEDKENAIQYICNEYEEKIEGYRISLESVGHDLEMEKNRSNSYYNRLNEVLQENEEQHTVADTLRQRVDDLTTLVNKLRDCENDVIEEKNEIIRNIKQAFKDKDIECDEQMNIKRFIDVELREYEHMLDTEEERLNINSSTVEYEEEEEQDEEYNDDNDIKKDTTTPLQDETDETPKGMLSFITGIFGLTPKKQVKKQSALSNDAVTTTTTTEILNPINIIKETDTTTDTIEEKEEELQDMNTLPINEKEQEEEEQQQNIDKSTRKQRKRKNSSNGDRIADISNTNDDENNSSGNDSSQDTLKKQQIIVAKRNGTPNRKKKSSISIDDSTNTKSTKKYKTDTTESIIKHTTKVTKIPTGNKQDDKEKSSRNRRSSTAVTGKNKNTANDTIKNTTEINQEEYINDNKIDQSLLMSGCNDDYKYIAIVNGSEKGVSLQGWSLCTKQTDYKYSFPQNTYLNPEETFIAKAPLDEDSDKVYENIQETNEIWLPSSVFSQDGDQCMLLSPDGTVKASVNIVNIPEYPKAHLKKRK